MSLRTVKLGLVAFVFAGCASTDVLSRIEGQYSTPSECTTLNSRGEHGPCGSDVRDTLRITRISPQSASFELASVQINAHQCEAEGVAELRGDSLIYIDPHASEPGQGLRIQITATELKLSYLKPITGRQPFCGTRAYIDRVSFPLSSRSK
jgi:hypothetical protein